MHSYIVHKLSIKKICTQSLEVEQPASAWLTSASYQKGGEPSHSSCPSSPSSQGCSACSTVNVCLLRIPLRAIAFELSFFTIFPRVFSLLDSECMSSAYSSESSSSICAVSGSKLDVELCVALRLCLYAVNTSEARTFIKSRLVPNAFISLL